MDIVKLIHQLACSICHGTDKPKPKIELLSMPRTAVSAELEAVPVNLLGLWDMTYYYTKAEDWAEVFDYIYFKFDMPGYIAERMDCDDFALLLKGLVNAFFGLNYFGVVIGNTPMGYHAWNDFRTENGLMQFEPQTGKYFPLGEQGYKPGYVLL